MQRYASISGFYLWVLAGIVACLPQISQAETIGVFAASSLRDAVGELAVQYQTRTGDELVLVFAASSTIARQVALGAPADVVLLADQDWADWLVAQGAVTQVAPFAGNRLVLIGRAPSEITGADGIRDALDTEMFAMGQVDTVPAGRYGKQALVSLGLWDALERNVVQAANVRAALRFVERGEVAFGVGYASDLVALPALFEVYEFAPDTHTPIIYSAAQVTQQGADFMAFLQTSTAQETLVRWGFSGMDAPQ